MGKNRLIQEDELYAMFFFLVFYWKCRYSCASICCVIEFLIISFLLALEFLKKSFWKIWIVRKDYISLRPNSKEATFEMRRWFPVEGQGPEAKLKKF